MRVAVSGTHRAGKSSLVEALSARLPGYRVIDEPYASLEDEGYEFSDPPAIEDFEAQLARSLALAGELPADALVDRCPLDFVAYLRALDEDYDVDADALRDAMAAFDLVVVVTIESPDRIAVSASEDRRLRRRVDEQIRAIVLEDGLGLGVEALEVTGSTDARAEQVLSRARRSRHSTPG